MMIKRAKNPEQRPFWALPQAQFQVVVDAQANDGWSPMVIAAHGPTHGALFSGVFEKRKPVGVRALGLVMGTVKHLTTIQGRNAHALKKGLRPVCIARYGEEDSRRFAGVWEDNTGADAVLWNNDGLLDSADELGQRIAAQESNWCRPVFLTLNKRVEFCSIYEASDVGKRARYWVARISQVLTTGQVAR
jgi:hypothetical protein